MQPKLPEKTLFDAHCHYSFAPHPDLFASWASGRLRGAFSTTVSPEEYPGSCATVGKWNNLKVGLGAHPWWVSRGKVGPEEVKRLITLVPGARFIGEVGLDFGVNGLSHSIFSTEEETKRVQTITLRAILKACAEQPFIRSIVPGASLSERARGRVFSFHAIRSADLIMDMLEEFDLPAHNTIIFHWFSGSNSQLHRALKMGAYFSVNRLMLNTRRGAEYAKQIPENRLLVETDLPDEPASSQQTHAPFVSAPAISAENLWEHYIASLTEAYQLLISLKGSDILEAIGRNVTRIFSE